MAARVFEEEGLLAPPRPTSTSTDDFDDDLLEYELHDFDDGPDAVHLCHLAHSPSKRWRRWLDAVPFFTRPALLQPFPTRPTSLRARDRLLARLAQFLALCVYTLVALLIICATFFPSYSNPPVRYINLQKQAARRGFVNDNHERVFIAASLYDNGGALLSGAWGDAVLDLVDLLGPENVFVSIYENSPDVAAVAALDAFAQRLPAESALTAEDLDLATLPHYRTQSGDARLSRIAFLAAVRNRALQPLADPSSPASSRAFDKLLFLNDIAFRAVDAANLLFSTALDESSGRTQYRAACAVDFVNPFKFYDTFATRDLEGYDMGVPFYPWFSSAGAAHSRRDVLAQTDAVRVKSCWGGMVAFEAKWFQMHLHERAPPLPLPSAGALDNTTTLLPLPPYAPLSPSSLAFRSSPDPYWDPSECCLIHADLALLSSSSASASASTTPPAIFINPYIRVAYDTATLGWFPITRRFERLYTPIHAAVNWLAHRPSRNPRQFQVPGATVLDRVWQWDDAADAAADGNATSAASNTSVTPAHPSPSPPPAPGHWTTRSRTADPGAFCGKRTFMYINEPPLAPGTPKWSMEKAPPGE